MKMSFDPPSGHEQAGWRPALVISPAAYNCASSLALFCPITSRVKGYPFEIGLPSRLAVSGVALADQVRSLDSKAHSAALVGRAPDTVVQDVLARLEPLVT